MGASQKSKLNSRQQKFVEAYAGNATEAARLAGYSGDENTLGVVAHKLLRNAKITQAIQTRETKTLKKLIATREDRQNFWTETMLREDVDLSTRLRASELLGRSQADFTDKVEHSGTMKLESLSDEDLDRRINQLLEEKKSK